MPWTMWNINTEAEDAMCTRIALETSEYIHLGLFPPSVFSLHFRKKRPKISVEFSPGTTGYKDRNQNPDTPLPIHEPVVMKFKQWEPDPFLFCKQDCSLKSFKMGMVQNDLSEK